MPFIDHFNILAPFYDHLIKFPTAEKLISIAGLPISGRLLDAGGGTGRVSATLREQASQVVVVDLSFGMLRKAGNKAGLQPVCGYTEALPFPNESFERIIMVDALHHLNDQAHTALELWRVLTPGGRLIIEEPDIRKTSVKLVALLEKFVLMRSNFLTPPQITSLFPQPHASLRIEYENFNALVVVDKFDG